MTTRLTVKLRGRTEAPAPGAEGAQFLCARGGKPEASHGPLQRLLGGSLGTDFLNRIVEHRHRSLEVSRFIRTHQLVILRLCTGPQVEFVPPRASRHKNGVFDK